MIDVFTVSPAPRLGEVRVLATSVVEHLPGSRFHWYVAGAWNEGMASRLGSAGEVVPLDGVSLPEGDGAQPSDGSGSSPELALPAAALALLRRPDCEGVQFFAPQVALFSSLPELVAGGLKSDIVLAPILLRPQPVTTSEPPAGELRALRHGAFSTSFVGVAPSPGGERFLRWWSERARGFIPPPNARRTLRPWLNLAPALFPSVRVLRSPRCCVGRDNLHERRLAGNLDDGITVDDLPLGFFDFTGLDDGSLEAAVRTGRGDHRTLDAIVQWYRYRREAGGEARAEDPVAADRW